MTVDVTIASPRSDFEFGTKAQTLDRLAGRLGGALLCDQMTINTTEWTLKPSAIVDLILARFGGRELVVRSSSDAEDHAESSNAGAFESVMGVACDAASIGRAVDIVIGSYGENGDGQEILIQEMVGNVALSGVVLTRDLDTGGPYYSINYDDFSGRTDTVTGGAESKTVLVHRANPGALHSPRMQAIISTARELEEICGRSELDIEFCITEDVELYILQVRPLAAKRRWKNLRDADIDSVVRGIRAELSERMQPETNLSGQTTIFGEMPDWNPAEMIGNSPRPLALSLYRNLITDSVWADARARMGYRNVERQLMIDFAGRPYIDTRLSFNSFLPADLTPELADRLVDHQLNGLADQPDLHDKIEFELAITCLDLDHATQMKRLHAAGFSAADTEALTGALHGLTLDALKPGGDGIRRLLATTDTLLEQDQDLPDAPLARAGALLDLTRRDGTLPFSMLARHAFIGAALLKSMVRRDVISADDADRLMRSVHTVAADLVIDMSAVARGEQTEAAFLARYGHLRPGTYDILSWRYDERPDLYLGHDARSAPETLSFEFSPQQTAALEQCLAEYRIDIDAEEVLDYITASIAAREQAKFAFTRGISDALSALVLWGGEAGVSREMLSFADIDDLLVPDPDAGRILAVAEERRGRYDVTRAIYLPHLIVEPDDIDVIRLLRGKATYITGETVTARSLLVDAGSAPELDGMIVLIESADPGYDWIFSHRIAALVTKFGGANSHMAIRCAEFGLPAAIGCGEKTFNDLLRAPAVELNCAARTIRAVGQAE
jgi:glutamine kinase